MPLLESWCKTYRDEGLPIAQGLRDLNECLGTHYKHSSLSRWRNGKKSPNSDVIDVMIRRVAPAVIRKCCKHATGRNVQRAIQALVWAGQGPREREDR